MNSIIKKVIEFLIKLLPKWTLKNYIVLESVPDFSDNTRAVFDEMMRRKLNEKYKIIWLVSNQSHYFPKHKNVKYVNAQSKKKYKYLLSFKCGICCNQMLHSRRKGQYTVYLSHGIPIKSIRAAGGEFPNQINAWVASSENTKELFAYEFNANIDKGVSLGYPRNDAFFEEKKNVRELFDVDFDKIIAWYPTFRQNKGGISASDSNDAMPIINSAEIATEFNNLLREKKTLVVIKPHFAQDVSYIKDSKLSNIIFIDDDFLLRHGMKSYSFVGSCDALLTDYSSIYYDYTLADKPIGLTWQDYDQYKSRPGFAVDMEYYMKGGEKIFSLEDLKSFVSNVAEGRDLLKEERREIRDFVHHSVNGGNSARVVDYIVEKAGLLKTHK